MKKTGPNDGAHSNSPLRGGKLNFFEGGIRPAAFVTSPLLPVTARGTTYSGLLHETDWFATLAYLAGATPPSDLDGINVWNTLEDPHSATPHRTEVLVADHILRSGRQGHLTRASPCRPTPDPALGGWGSTSKGH